MWMYGLARTSVQGMLFMQHSSVVCATWETQAQACMKGGFKKDWHVQGRVIVVIVVGGGGHPRRRHMRARVCAVMVTDCYVYAQVDPH